MALLSIKTPAGGKVQAGGVGAQLQWNPAFGAHMTQKLTVGQRFIDSETIRLMQPYTPLRTAALIRSATFGTVIGSGRINQTVPYATWQYYRTDTTRSYDPRRGAQWFERMKIDHKDYLLREAARRTGARPVP